MQASLLVQFSIAEESFLASMSQGPAEIEAFYRFWSDLQERFTEAVTQNNVNEETCAMARKASSTIEILATRFIELEDAANGVISSLQHDLDVLFADLSLNERISLPLSDKIDVSLVSAPPVTQDNAVASLAPYIKGAYAWLLSNLHNPYPPKETKACLARESGSSPKDIDNWFINVRKRIGWNTLRMKHYENKRGKIVDAATNFFRRVPRSLHSGPYTTHPPGTDPANHDSEFKVIENRAKELYSDKLFETPMTTELDGAFRNVTPEKNARVQAKAEHHRQMVKSRKAKDLQRLYAYPSPERSPDRSLEPSLDRSPDPSAASLLPVSDATPTTSRKRRNCERDSPQLDAEDRSDEPQKRSRLDSYQISRDLAVASLPSPAASLSDITRESSVSPSGQASSENDYIVFPTPPAAPSGKRKRRLSDAGYDGPSKRPHNALAVPRLQTVSDPLPLANPIISEFYKVFGQAISDNIPSPVSVESLDDTPVEVDFYNYNTFPDTIQPLWLTNSTSDPRPAPLPSAVNSELLLLDKYQVSDPSSSFLFENYLKNLDTPPASTDIPFFPDILSHDNSTLFSYENMLPAQPPQEDILSDPYFQITNLPWDFQGDVDSFSIPVSSPQIDRTQDEKEAKRKQIEVLRAQLQDLEAEL